MTPARRIDLFGSVLSGGARPGRLSRGLGPLGIGLALLAIVSAVMALGSAPADAGEDAGEQGPRFLVSNLGIGVAGSGGIQRTLHGARPAFAQAFTTGPKTGGYALRSLGIHVYHFFDMSTVGDHLRVTINGVASEGGPGGALCTLTHPPSFSSPGVSAFEAPTGAGACPQLAAETTYFVVIEWVNPSGTDRFALIPQTSPTEESAASEEDPGGAEGWSIADHSYYLTVSSGARTWTAYDETASFKIVVKEAARPNSPATGLPAITGTAQVGGTLTAATSGIADDDGLDNVSYTYQWLADDSDISGATGRSYTLTAGEQGQTIQVRVSFTDDADNPESLTSAATAAVGVPESHDRPYDLTATAADGSITLTWQNPDTHADFGLYRILRHRPELGEAQPLVYVEYTFISDRTFTDSAVEPGVLYGYAVRAVKDTWGYLGPASDRVELRMPQGETGKVPQPNSPAAGAPAISGTAQVGETLTASTSGITDEDGLDNVTYTYQWVRSDGSTDSAIENATDFTYTLTADDQGQTIQVRVDFTDDAGNEETLSSAATVAVAAAPNRAATGAPSIRGVVQDQQVLTADTVGIADVDGTDNAAFSYQWMRVQGGDAVDIAGATGSTYTLTSADVGDGIQLRVSFADDRENAESLTSAATAAVAASDATRELLWLSTMTPEDPDGLDTDFNFDASADNGSLSPAAFTNGEATPAIAFLGASFDSGTTLALELATLPTTTQVSHWRLQLHGSELAFTDAAVTQTGASPPSYRFQWEAAELAVDDRGLWDDGDAFTVSLLAALNLSATGVPAISGTAQVGETLNAATTDIADGNGLDSVSYAYQWTAGGSDIDGATGSGYTLTSNEEGHGIQVRVSFTDDDGFSETSTSVATATVVAGEQANSAATGLPAIVGTARVGETLTADTSAINDDDGLANVSYSYQWLAGGSDIAGATGDNYTLTASEQGKTVQVRVTFTDDADNQESLTSDATSAVAAKPNTPAEGQPTISGTAQVGEKLTVDTSRIADDDGLVNVSYGYQWVRTDGNADTDIGAATASTYTLVDADEGKTIKVRVTFTDGADHEETLTSAPTAEVAARPMLTASFENEPTSHDGSSVFTFQLRFSEEFKLSYKVLRDDDAFEVTGGTLTRARRLTQGSNTGWEIHIVPDSNADVTIVLPVTTDCGADGAICTADGRMLSNRNELTVSKSGG